MTDAEKYKNLTLDVETYDLLKLWADREVRSVSGHVKWLILKHLPRDLRTPPPRTNPFIGDGSHLATIRPKIEEAPTPIITRAKIKRVNGGKSYTVGEDGYERARGTSKYKIKGFSQGSVKLKLLEILQLYGEPLTNFDLANLASDQGSHDIFAKRTSQAYYNGILERKNISATDRRGVYIYRIAPLGEKMLKAARLRKPSI